MTTHVIALLTCHNRKEQTVQCMRALFAGRTSGDSKVSAVLVDDGSTDGTGDAVNTSFPFVVIDRGDGSLFWNRGMHQAHQIAVQADPDFLLWLNDDTVLASDAMATLLSTYQELKAAHGCDVLVVGTTIERRSSELTYGGLVATSRLRRFSFRKLPIASEPQECEAMNGNIVLVSRAIYQRLGPVDPVFEHALGDIDYAIRARKAGFRTFVAPGFQGFCSANVASASYLDPNLPPGQRWTQFRGRKGLPVASWRHFVRNHGGWAWPAYFAWPYLRFALRLTRDFVFRRTTRA